MLIPSRKDIFHFDSLFLFFTFYLKNASNEHFRSQEVCKHYVDDNMLNLNLFRKRIEENLLR